MRLPVQTLSSRDPDARAVCGRTLFLAALFTAPAHAETVSQVAPATGLWFNEGNWCNTSSPQASDNVTISGATVTVTGLVVLEGALSGALPINDARLSVTGEGSANRPTVTEYTWDLCNDSDLIKVLSLKMRGQRSHTFLRQYKFDFFRSAV